MKKLLLLAFVLCSSLAFAQEYTRLGEEVKLLDGIPICVDGDKWRYRIELVEVVDATHFKVRTKGKEVQMSLWGLASPGIKQEFGEQAADWVRGYLKKNEYEFYTDMESGSFLKCAGDFLDDLVSAGWAWIPPEFITRYEELFFVVTPYSILRDDQEDARANGVGVWAKPGLPWKRYK